MSLTFHEHTVVSAYLCTLTNIESGAECSFFQGKLTRAVRVMSCFLKAEAFPNGFRIFASVMIRADHQRALSQKGLHLSHLSKIE